MAGTGATMKASRFAQTAGFARAAAFTKSRGANKPTGDQQLVKRINRSVLLRLLRAHPGLSRARLAQQSGLTKSTVGALVRELLDEHWLSEAGTPVASSGLGRPSTPLHIDTQVRVLIGAEVGVQQIRVVSVSLTGVVLATVQEQLQSTDSEQVCCQAARLVRQACNAISLRKQVLCGIGVCLPGAVDEVSSLVRFAPNLGWRDVEFAAMLTRALAVAGVPPTDLHLHNDSDAAALGEYEFVTGESEDPLLFVNCDVGVGAGIVLNDRLFTGARGMAGEVGHSIMQVDGPPCSCGRRGCAETFIGARALSRPGGLEHAGSTLGVLIQNLDVLFNPRVVVVGGPSCNLHPGLIEDAKRTVHAYAAAAGVPAPVIRGAHYGLLAAAVGAAAAALHRHLRPLHMDAVQPANKATTRMPSSGGQATGNAALVARKMDNEFLATESGAT